MDRLQISPLMSANLKSINLLKFAEYEKRNLQIFPELNFLKPNYRPGNESRLLKSHE